MATSGSINFNQTRDEIIKDALYKIEVLDPAETVDEADLQLCARQLNRMVKSWQNRGIRLWTYSEIQVFLTASTESYSLGSSHAALSSDVVATTLSGDEAAGQTILSVTSSTGMAASDNVGIELADGTRQWTTISTVDSSTQITVATALTGAASEGATVYTYTTLLNRPLKLYNGRIKSSDGTERAMTEISRQEYMNIVSKSTSSAVSAWYYDPGLSTGTLYVWPTTNDVDDRAYFSAQRVLEDFDNSTDNPDFPTEWLDALVWNLAVRIAPDFGRQNIRDIKEMADRLLLDAISFDAETAGVQLYPDFGR